MSIFAALKRLVAGAPATAVDQLYQSVVDEARQPAWYLSGAVPDTLDGRFDMLALVLSLLMLRLEQMTGDDPTHKAAQLSVDLADRFIADMDGNLRQDGVGDQVVPRHLGHMMAALGGRLGAYRTAGGDPAALAGALARNLYRGAAVDPAALDWAVARTRALITALDGHDFATLAAGRVTLAA
jgi:cytochrome b pre-mRNA-processing protein 3